MRDIKNPLAMTVLGGLATALTVSLATVLAMLHVAMPPSRVADVRAGLLAARSAAPARDGVWRVVIGYVMVHRPTVLPLRSTLNFSIGLEN